MNKRIIIIAGSIILFLGLIVTGIFMLGRDSEVNRDVIEFVPVDASFIIKTKNFSLLVKNIRNDSKVWQELRNIPELTTIDESLLTIDSLITANEDLSDLLQNSQVVVSAHRIGKSSTGFLYFITVPSKYSEGNVKDIFASSVGTQNISKQESYENVPTCEISFHGKKFNAAFADEFHVMILSSSSLLLNNAIRQMHSDITIAQQQGFKKITNTVKGRNVDANVYIHYAPFINFLSSCINPEYRNKATQALDIADWSELDLTVGNDIAFMSGYTVANDTLGNTLSLFQNQPPQKVSMTNIIPTNTALFMVFGIKDFELFGKNFAAYMQRMHTYNNYRIKIDSINNAFNVDIKKHFFSFADKETGIVYTNIEGLTPPDNVFVILGTKSKSKAQDMMLEFIDSIAVHTHTDGAAYMNTFDFDAETQYKIYHIPVQNLLGKLFGAVYMPLENSYFTFIDNYLVFGNSVTALSKFIQSSILNKSIASDINYLNLSDYQSSHSNVYIYANMLHVTDLHKKYLDPAIFELLQKNSAVFQKVQNIGIQINTDGDLLYTSVFLSRNADYYEKPQTIWETLLDTIAAFKPQLVLNHNTNQSEIFIQDLKNNIYLINDAGRILWKVQLPEKILGKVYQVDYFKNRKLQLLFGTKNNIYLIDRNGNNVERYPVQLRSPAVAGLSLFDYDKNRDYRIFVPCEDRKIYSYQIDGSLVKGWEFDKAENDISTEVKYFRVENKDFLVFSDIYKLYILDRRGTTRVKTNEIFQKASCSDIALEVSPSGPRFVTTDVSGVVYYFYLNGSTDKVQFDEFSPKHYFTCQDLNGDHHYEYIFIDKKKLTVYKDDKSKLFSYTFNAEILDAPLLFEFSATNDKIGVVDRTDNNIYLFNPDGSLYEAFPLRGNTLFSIGRLSKSERFNLIVGNNNNFLLNYSVK